MGYRPGNRQLHSVSLVEAFGRASRCGIDDLKPGTCTLYSPREVWRRACKMVRFRVVEAHTQPLVQTNEIVANARPPLLPRPTSQLNLHTHCPQQHALEPPRVRDYAAPGVQTASFPRPSHGHPRLHRQQRSVPATVPVPLL